MSACVQHSVSYADVVKSDADRFPRINTTTGCGTQARTPSPVKSKFPIFPITPESHQAKPVSDKIQQISDLWQLNAFCTELDHIEKKTKLSNESGDQEEEICINCVKNRNQEYSSYGPQKKVDKCILEAESVSTESKKYNQSENTNNRDQSIETDETEQVSCDLDELWGAVNEKVIDEVYYYEIDEMPETDTETQESDAETAEYENDSEGEYDSRRSEEDEEEIKTGEDDDEEEDDDDKCVGAGYDSDTRAQYQSDDNEETIPELHPRLERQYAMAMGNACSVGTYPSPEYFQNQSNEATASSGLHSDITMYYEEPEEIKLFDEEDYYIPTGKPTQLSSTYVFPSKGARGIEDVLQFWEMDYQVGESMVLRMGCWEEYGIAPKEEEEEIDYRRFCRYKALIQKWEACNRSMEQWYENYMGASLIKILNRKQKLEKIHCCNCCRYIKGSIT